MSFRPLFSDKHKKYNNKVLDLHLHKHNIDELIPTETKETDASVFYVGVVGLYRDRMCLLEYSWI